MMECLGLGTLRGGWHNIHMSLRCGAIERCRRVLRAGVHNVSLPGLFVLLFKRMQLNNAMLFFGGTVLLLPTVQTTMASQFRGVTKVVSRRSVRGCGRLCGSRRVRCEMTRFRG